MTKIATAYNISHTGEPTITYYRYIRYIPAVRLLVIAQLLIDKLW